MLCSSVCRGPESLAALALVAEVVHFAVDELGVRSIGTRLFSDSPRVIAIVVGIVVAAVRTIVAVGATSVGSVRRDDFAETTIEKLGNHVFQIQLGRVAFWDSSFVKRIRGRGPVVVGKEETVMRRSFTAQRWNVVALSAGRKQCIVVGHMSACIHKAVE